MILVSAEIGLPMIPIIHMILVSSADIPMILVSAEIPMIPVIQVILVSGAEIPTIPTV
jgi:hypothetical protein